MTWFMVILFDIIPKKEQPDFPKEYRGKIKEQINKDKLRHNFQD